MGINLDEKLNAIIKQADSSGNRDGQLSINNTTELSIFEQEVQKLDLKQKQKDDIYEKLGLLTKKDKETNQAQVLEAVKKYVARGDNAQDMLDALKREFGQKDAENKFVRNADGSIQTNPQYTEILQEVEYLINSIPDYNSEKDVKQIDNLMTKDMNKKDKFAKDIVSQLQKQAKNTQIEKEFETLKEKYNEVKDKMQNTELVKQQGHNYNAYLDIVKEELKDEKLWRKSYTQDAFKKLEAYAYDDAKQEVKSSLNKFGTSEEDNVNKYLKEQNKAGDDLQVKARKNMKSVTKAVERGKKTNERATELQNVSLADIKDGLKEETFKKLNASYLTGRKNANGSFNLEPLSQALMLRVGKDYLVNQSDDTEMSEMRNIQKELKALTGGQEFSKSEIKDLLDFMNIKIEKNSRTAKTVLNAALYGIPGAIGSLLSARKVDIQQTVRIIVSDKDVAEDIKNQLGSTGGLKISSTSSGDSVISINQRVLQDRRVLEVLTGAGLGVLQGALFALIFGEGKKFEESCVSIADFDFSNPRYTDFSQYEEYIHSVYHPKAKADAIVALAMTFVTEKDGKQVFDATKFDTAMKHIAGVGSNVNCTELQAGNLESNKIEEQKNTPSKMPSQAKLDTPPTQQTEECNDDKCSLDKNEETGAKSITHKIQYGDSWEGLVQAYFPTWKECFGKMYGTGGAIQALKRAVAKDDKEYKKLLQGYIPSSIEIPHELGDCQRNDNGTVDSKYANTSEGPKGYIGGVGTKYNNDGEITLQDCNGTQGKGKTIEGALADLNNKTGKNYTEKDINQ